MHDIEVVGADGDFFAHFHFGSHSIGLSSLGVGEFGRLFVLKVKWLPELGLVLSGLDLFFEVEVGLDGELSLLWVRLGTLHALEVTSANLLMMRTLLLVVFGSEYPCQLLNNLR